VLVGLFGNTENNPKKKKTKTNTQKKNDCGATTYSLLWETLAAIH
jgi:hypothetical protein